MNEVKPNSGEIAQRLAVPREYDLGETVPKPKERSGGLTRGQCSQESGRECLLIFHGEKISLSHLA